MSSNQQARQDPAGEVHFRPLNIPATVFPVDVTLPNGDEFSSYGMLLRDYFVAHAPAEIPTWFEPTVPPRPLHPTRPQEPLSEEEHNEMYGLGDWLDSSSCETPRIKQYALAMESHRKDIGAWSREYERQKLLQWPCYWADQQLALRDAWAKKAGAE